MTTLFKKEVKCCVCGKKSIHTGIGSTNSFGAPDLDTRPPEMRRSTIYYSIQRCPSCGYCAPNISEGADNICDMVQTPEYQDILKSSEFPETATSFLALSHEKEQEHKYTGAAWDAIQAAWICDDENRSDAAVKCRKRALSMIERGRAHSRKIALYEGLAETITIDLMRRSGFFSEALKLVEEAMNMELDESLIQIVNYQKSLINRKDVDARSASKALGED